jgi:hypothetical protein
MSEMDRRVFVGAAALGSVAAAVLTASSVQAAGQSGYFVIAEIVSKKEKADELKVGQGARLLGLHADGSHRRAGPLSDVRAVDGQGCARCPHSHA